MIDPEKFGSEVAVIIREHVAARLAPLEARIAALEAEHTKAAKPRVRVKTDKWQRPIEADQ